MKIRNILLLLLLLFPWVSNSYDRADWPHWSSVPKDISLNRYPECQGKSLNVRNKILIDRSIDPVVINPDTKSCTVLTGRWMSPYTGKELTQSSDVQIDHLVPLAYVDARVPDWTREQRRAYANSELQDYHLLIVEGDLNMQKRASPPYKWLPPDRSCEYIIAYLLTMMDWNIHLSEGENKLILQSATKCTANQEP